MRSATLARSSTSLVRHSCRRAHLVAAQISSALVCLADPWFNYRATEYLVNNGWHAFFHWFDHSVWYPLGRPVATTIYPAMQITAAVIYSCLEAAGAAWSLEDVCAYVPVWFGMVATFFTGLLAHECSGGSVAAAAGGAAVMAVLPAHLSRSVGGGFDNESVAITGAHCLSYPRASPFPSRG